MNVINLIGRKPVIILSLLIIFILIVALGQSLTGLKTGQEPSVQPSATPSISFLPNSKNIQILKVVPSSGSDVNAGDNIQFILTVSNSVNPDQLSVKLNAKSTLDNTQSEDIEVKIGTQENKIVVIADKAFEPYTNYTFSLYLKPSELIHTNTYFIGAAPRPIVLKNDNTLLPYLPVTGEFFKLDYIPARNVYVFTLLSDPSKPGDYQSQLKKGMAELDELISKYGADKSQMVIEYQY